MDTLSALDTFGFVYLAYSMLVHGYGADRAALHTGSLYFNDCGIGTSLCTFSAAFTFVRIDKGTIVTDGNSSEITGLFTGFCQTSLTQVGNYVAGGNRTFLAGGVDNLYNVAALSGTGTLSFCQSDSLSDNFPFLVNTAAETRFGPGNHIVGNILFFLVQFTGKCQLSHFSEYLVLNF